MTAITRATPAARNTDHHSTAKSPSAVVPAALSHSPCRTSCRRCSRKVFDAKRYRRTLRSAKRAEGPATRHRRSRAATSQAKSTLSRFRCEHREDASAQRDVRRGFGRPPRPTEPQSDAGGGSFELDRIGHAPERPFLPAQRLLSGPRMYEFVRLLRVSKGSPARDVVTALTPAQPVLQLGVKAPGHRGPPHSVSSGWSDARIGVEMAAGKRRSRTRLNAGLGLSWQSAPTPQTFGGRGDKPPQNRNSRDMARPSRGLNVRGRAARQLRRAARSSELHRVRTSPRA
jgi:hypothetical protein